MLATLIPNGVFVTTVYAYNTNYPNTHVNTGNQKEDLIAVAETQIGYTYNSGTKYGAWYGSGFTSSAWCAMFVSWCANQAGIPTSIIPKHASCDDGMAWFKNNNRWHNAAYYGGNYTPIRGDIVYYSDNHTQSDSTHVGIVTGISGNYLQVIEGNTDSKVHKYTQNSKRSLSSAYVLGYGTPNYNGVNVNHTRDTNYGTNFTATAKNHIDVFNEDHSDPGNYYIDPGDVCTIHEVYTDGCCKVTYPASGAPGGTRTYYCKFNSTNFSWEDPLSLTFSPSSLSLKEGETATVNINFSGDGIYTLNAVISNTDVCSVSFNGIDWGAGTTSLTISGNSAGYSKITVYFYDTSGNAFYSNSFDVTVTEIDPLSLVFSPSSLSLKEGESGTVSIKLTGEGIDHLSFSNGNDNVCSASFNGIDWGTGTTSLTVYGNSVGTSSITVYLNDSSGNALYSKSFSVAVITNDTATPIASISSTNNVASNQTVTLTMGDDTALTGYYWGTSSSTSPGFTSISGKNYSTMKDVSASGTYYLTVKDTNGNVTQKSITFYKTTLNANGGSVSLSSVLSASGNYISLPTPSRSGFIFSGWSTSSTATSGVYRFAPSSNQTYYAVWNSMLVLTSTNVVSTSQEVALEINELKNIEGYYWGTNADYSKNQYVNVTYVELGDLHGYTDRWQNVETPGTYYATLKDDYGNILETASITFYKTSLNANGGSVSPQSVVTASGNSFTLPTPTRSGYTFKGWSTSSTATSGIYSLTPNGSNTYYAVWSANSTDTTKPTASISSTNNVASSQNVMLTMGDDTALAGYYWGTSSSTSVSYTSISGESYSTAKTVSSSGTYYLTVKDTSGNITQKYLTFYTTTLNANGGSVSPTFVVTASGNSFTLPTPTRSGYTFKGWSTSSTATSGVYSLTPNGSNTYYAVWSANPTDTTKSTASISSTNNVASSQTVTLTMGDDTALDGYYWGTSSSTSVSYTSITGKSYSTTKTVSSSGTYYLTVKDSSGNITQKSLTFYTTTLNANGGSVSPSPVVTASGNSFTFPTPIRSGYTFKGWSTSSTATSGVYSLTPNGSNTYYAIWQSVPTTDALIKVSTVKGTAGKTVDVNVSLSNNPGMVAMTLNITYNTSALRLVSVKDAGVLGSSSHKPEYSSPYTLSWANDTATSNYTVNGTIATLSFEIIDATPVGDYPITVSYDYNNYGIYNKDLNRVNFNTENGTVQVIDVIYGDVDSNGIVNNLDRVYLTRYLANWNDYQNIDLNAADVDCNGTVNNLDRVILTRYLANWSAYSELPYSN